MSLTNAAVSTLWTKKKFTISSSATVIVDSSLITSFDHLEYIIHVKDSGDTLSRSLHLSVHQKAGSSLKEIVFAKFGDAINIDINTANNAGTFELNITNNEAFDVELKWARLKLN